jgi:hypothetical protein
MMCKSKSQFHKCKYSHRCNSQQWSPHQMHGFQIWQIIALEFEIFKDQLFILRSLSDFVKTNYDFWEKALHTYAFLNLIWRWHNSDWAIAFGQMWYSYIYKYICRIAYVYHHPTCMFKINYYRFYIATVNVPLFQLLLATLIKDNFIYFHIFSDC